MPSPADPAPGPFNLRRFLSAQKRDYHRALAELRAGRKCSHWMWYVFPQIQGLGFSAASRLYAISSVDEARAYLEHPVLGERLLDCATALLEVQDRSAREIMGSPDDLKLAVERHSLRYRLGAGIAVRASAEEVFRRSARPANRGAARARRGRFADRDGVTYIQLKAQVPSW